MKRRRRSDRQFAPFFQSQLGFVPGEHMKHTRGRWETYPVSMAELGDRSQSPLLWWLTDGGGFGWLTYFVQEVDWCIEMRTRIFADFARRLPGPGRYIAYADLDRLAIQ